MAGESKTDGNQWPNAAGADTGCWIGTSWRMIWRHKRGRWRGVGAVDVFAGVETRKGSFGIRWRQVMKSLKDGMGPAALGTPYDLIVDGS
jgi:hypothetical protein